MYDPNFRNPYPAQRPQQPLFPAHFARLPVVCNHHNRPVAMQFIGYSWSDKLPSATGFAQRVAFYRCPMDATVEAYAQHSRTGEPFLLRTIPAGRMRGNPAPAARPAQRHSFYA